MIVIVGREILYHHHLEATFETATATELRQKTLYTTPSGWWWCIESVFRDSDHSNNCNSIDNDVNNNISINIINI